VILTTEQLPAFRGTVCMVSGGFDPLHEGHIEYFRQAAALGAPVLCNVSSDEFVASKHPPLLAQERRVLVIDALRYIDFTYPAAESTVEVLERLRPRLFAKGSDWRGRLPQEEVEVCARHDIEVVCLDSVLNSSSEILRRLEQFHVARLEQGPGPV
jgi:cytidyltransferase-like protein